VLPAQNYNITLRSTLEYPGQTLANVCGFAQDGKEYALLGASQGLIIVDVTDPEAPVNIQQIPGPNNLWKEIKVYGKYAYVTSEGGQGVQIVDLSSLPTPTTVFQQYKGDGLINGTLNTIHALHIDEAKGFLYLYGTNLFNGGAVICDLNADPYNPVFVGQYSTNGYIHDGFVDNDTLYAAHITAGFMSIADLTNKAQPKVLGTVETPGSFTHNTWILSDRKTILTTDEDFPSFVTSYDVSDPTDIRELDRSSTYDGTNAIGHNTHTLNDWAVTSYYIDGVDIIDAHRPDNLVEVARYDTWAQGGTFDGCWGVYPYLPSGNLIATNIPNTGGGIGKMFVLSPTYVRACYLEGQVLNGCDNQPLADVSIVFEGAPYNTRESSRFNGVYKGGVPVPGTYTVTFSKPGYVTHTTSVVLNPGEVMNYNLTLYVADAVDAGVRVVNAATTTPVANTLFIVSGNNTTLKINSDMDGRFDLFCLSAGTYQIGAWGYLPTQLSVTASGTYELSMSSGYYDDFALDLGWVSSSNANSGDWELGEPQGTFLQTAAANPDVDADSDNNDQCYVTGNGGGNAGNDDVDNGEVVLTTPPMKLAGYADAKLSFYYWFFNAGGQGTPPNDKMEVKVFSGNQSAVVFSTTTSESAWRFQPDISLGNFVSLTDNVRIQFVTSDQGPPNGHLVEAAMDIFQVVPVTVSTRTPSAHGLALSVYPNPGKGRVNVSMAGSGAGKFVLEVRNALGQLIDSRDLQGGEAATPIEANWAPGVYFLQASQADGRQVSCRFIQQ
jgi:choice-of-anchor B domain-containing protein